MNSREEHLHPARLCILKQLEILLVDLLHRILCQDPEILLQFLDSRNLVLIRLVLLCDVGFKQRKGAQGDGNWHS